MSFQPKDFWMPRDGGAVTNGDINYDNSSKLEPKRSHQWFMDASGSEPFSNKRQAIEAVTSRPLSGISSLTVSPWDNNPTFNAISGQATDRLFGSEPMRSVNLVDRNMTPFNAGDISMVRKSFGGQYGNESSVSLSMSHGTEDPSAFLNFGGIRKVKVNQVREPDNSISATMGTSYRSGNGSAIPTDTGYRKGHNSTISLGSGYHHRNENNMSMAPGYNKGEESFMPMSHAFTKEDGNFISMGHNYERRGENILSMGQPFARTDGNFIAMGPSYTKGEGDGLSMGSSHSKEHANFISVGQNFGKVSDSFISMASSYNRIDDNMTPIGQTFDKADPNVVAVGHTSTYDKGDSGILSMGQNYKGEGNTISFGGFEDEHGTHTSVGIIGNYELVIDNETLPQVSVDPGQTDVGSGANPIVNSSSASKANSKAENIPKNKEPKTAKKVPPNNFPSNVKSLLSTGMLDGVSVKYVSWSREKNLRGIIKGTGYLCGCENCNHSKSLNAYEFERHAGCKTKHPNNHIYFDNGKTIYAVVQELKNTPQELLFDTIQTVTGSTINQKNFRIWKASYQAATRELQRIYGKDEVAMPS